MTKSYYEIKDLRKKIKHNQKIAEYYRKKGMRVNGSLRSQLFEIANRYSAKAAMFKNKINRIEFMDKMESIGIHCDSRGIARKLTNPFVSFLKKHKVEVEL